jgi:hypothetical protein
MAHRWPASERPRHECASSVLDITVRVLIITLPLLLLAIAPLVAGGSDDAGTSDLIGLRLF